MKVRPIFAVETVFALALTVLALSGCRTVGGTVSGPTDPGVRSGPPGAGGPLQGLTADESAFFHDGAGRFAQVEAVAGGTNNGLGPRFNGNQCLMCHAQPAPGGSSPNSNPLMPLATLDGAKNSVPWFIAPAGPVREARFKKNPDGSNDGEVHDLFVIAGRADAPGCNIAQPDFTPAGDPVTGQRGNANIVFRIPTPLFGLGLVEAIPDSAIIANSRTGAAARAAEGIYGHPNAILSGNANISGNDGTITRFGWKAQNKSLLMFAAEAYNVEMGISNPMFPQERDETPACNVVPSPNDVLNFTVAATGAVNPAVLSDIEAFADFMRLLAPPAPAPDTPSTVSGRAAFIRIGCSHCHTPAFTTGAKIASGSSTSPSAALSGQTVHLYSDLLVHHMGKGLADGITQGGAGPDEFRTAPLWGVGQRVFFLHDGRTSSIVDAIRDHKSPGSEASRIVDRFNALTTQQQQDIVNFLRSL